MSTISSIAGTNYSLIADSNVAGGYRLSRNSPHGSGDSIAFSDEAKLLAAAIAQKRAADAAALSAEERYNAAVAFGRDYQTALKESLEQPGTRIPKLEAIFEPSSITKTSKLGTVIGISNVDTWGEGDSPGIYTAQITRKDGFQLNITLDEDVRINDLEDGGLIVYYAQSGVTKHYDAEGNESILHDAPKSLGSSGDDIIINRHSSLVDAGDGDDTIINLARNATIRGGAGDDEIIVPIYTSGLDIDGGEGNNTIAIGSIYSSTIAMNSGNNTLMGQRIKGTTISSSSNNTFQLGILSASELISTGGSLDLQAQFTTGNTITLSDAGNTLNLGATFDDVINTGNGNDHITLGGSMGSTINTGAGDDTIIVTNGLSRATLDTGDGDNTVHIEDLFLSTLKTGNGKNTVYVEKLGRSTIKAGDGDNDITIGDSNTSHIQTGGGANSIHVSGDSWFSSYAGGSGTSLQVDGFYISAEELERMRSGLPPKGGYSEPQLEKLWSAGGNGELSPEELERLWRSSANEVAQQSGGLSRLKQDGPKGTALEEKEDDSAAEKEFKKSVMSALGLGESAKPAQAARAYAMQRSLF